MGKILPDFMNYGDNMRYVNKLLIGVCITLGVVVVLLAAQVGRAKFIYIDPTTITGVAQVGYVPPKFAEHFASHFVYTLMTVTPEDALQQYKAAYNLMSQQLASKMKGVLEAEINTIQQGNILITTVPIKVSTQQIDTDHYTSSVIARKTTFSFGKVVGEKYLDISLTIHKTSPLELNPWGLEVTSYDYKEIAHTDAYVPTTNPQEPVRSANESKQ